MPHKWVALIISTNKMKLVIASSLLYILSVQAIPTKCVTKPPSPPTTPPPAGTPPIPFQGKKLFAPFTQTWIYSAQDTLLKAMQKRNLDTIVAAFVIAQVNGPWAACNSTQTLDPSYNLTWGGDATSGFSDQVKEVQMAGKEVIISFGGYADPVLFPNGREIAGLITDVDKLANAYIDFIGRHNVSKVDFDIEEGGLLEDSTVSLRRNDAILKIVEKFPKIQISYTLPVDESGLKSASLALLADAVRKNISISSVNLMAMNFGEKPQNATNPEMLNVGEKAINSIKATYKQFQESNIPYKIGVIPMLGQNDFINQVFTLEDAKNLKAFVESANYVTYLGYWSMERDTPGVVPSGFATPEEGGCFTGYAVSKNSGTNTPEGAYLDALRL